MKRAGVIIAVLVRTAGRGLQASPLPSALASATIANPVELAERLSGLEDVRLIDEDGSPGTDADLKSVISKGAAEFGGNQMMAPWGGILSDADVDDVIIFVRSLKK